MPQGTMNESDIQSAIHTAINAAESYMSGEIQPQREKAQKYFDGRVDLEHEDGRSEVVVTKVRDVVRGVKPSLMRVFLSNDKFVEYVPKTPQQVEMAEQATAYAHWKFNECGGYNVLSNAIHDALVKKIGIIKVWWDVNTTADIVTYENLTEQEMLVIAADDEVEIIEHTQEVVMEIDEFGMEVESNRHSMKISHQREEGDMKVENVPPEEFFINSSAKSLDDFIVCGQNTEMVVGDLVAMGYDYDEVIRLAGSGDDLADTEEKLLRHGEDFDDAANLNDPSMTPIMVTEAYMRMDVDGTGVPVLHRFICAGTNHHILEMEPWDVVPFAALSADPEPHAFFGRSLAELVLNDQDTTTSVLRGIIDNTALVNTPRTILNEELVELDDVLNNEIGAVIRAEDINAVRELVTPFVAGQTLPALQYLDQLVEEKTGVTRASMGLDPDALQNTTATAAALTAQQGSGQVEVMAGNLAEGMKRLFKLMLRCLVTNSPEETLMRLSGKFVPVNPAVWDNAMDVAVNVGLGTGKEDTRAAALMQTLQLQREIIQQYGFGNGFVSMVQVRNTLADMLALGGIRNTDRYYAPIGPEFEQQILAQQEAAAQQQPQVDQVAQAMIQAEQIKAGAKQQSDLMKLQTQQQTDMMKLRANTQIEAEKMNRKQGRDYAELQRKYTELRAADDRERDKMAQDLVVKAAEILGNYGTTIDVERVRMLQQAPRDANGNIIA